MIPDKLPANGAFTVYTDGSVEHHVGAVTLSDAQRMVGGYVQIVEHEGAQFLMNEDGRLKQLPVNPGAVKLLRGAHVLGADAICGNVVVLTGKRRWG